MALRRREDLEAREGVDIARMAKEGAGSLVFAAVTIVALVVVLAISYGLQTDWDFTIEGAESLAPQTVDVLRGLSDPVALYALYGRQNELQRESYWRLLRSFRQETDLLSVEFVDPLRQPGRLVQIGVDPKSQDVRDGMSVVVSGDRRLTFRGMDEQDITNALLEVGRTEARVVGMVRGFGEHDPGSAAGGGYAEAKRALEQEYYDVIDVDPSRPIPDDVTLLVVAGPNLPIPDDVIDRLHAWLERGGRLLAMIEPGDAAGANRLLQRWGLRVTDEVVVDPRNNVNESDQFLRATDYTGHPVVTGFGSRMPSAFPVAGRVVDFETGEGALFHEPLVHSSSFSSSVSEDGTRSAGPFALAAASWQQHRGTDQETRVVLFGDSDWASNAYLSVQANQNLFLNAVAWLARESELITIRRHELEGQLVDLTRAEAGRIQWSLLLVPAVIIVVGVVVAIRRRGR